MRVPTVGAWRSLVAHLHGVQGVGGSNPLAPTNYFSQFDIRLWSPLWSLSEWVISRSVLPLGGRRFWLRQGRIVELSAD